MPSCNMTMPKIFLTVLTLVFWFCAAGLLFIGTRVYIEFNEYEKITQYMYTLLPAAIIMVAAVFLFVIGLIGCIGAFKEQRCLLGVYFTVLLVILLASIAASIFGYIYRDQVDSGLTDGLKEAMDHYGLPNGTVWTQEIDFMQTELKCCGVNNYTEWQNTLWHDLHKNETAPDSCYENPQNQSTLYTRGCYNYMRQQFMSHLGIVAGVSVGFAVILFIGMVCSCLLFCRRREEQPYIGLTSPEHMRV